MNQWGPVFLALLALSVVFAQMGICADVLDARALLNSKCFIPSLGQGDGVFEQLKDGNYKHDDQQGGLDKSLLAFGTVNGHALAVAYVTWNTGGSGWWEELALYAVQEGAPKCVGTVDLEDRAQVKKLSFKNGVVLLDWIHHADKDPAMNPTVHQIKRIKLSEFEATDKASELILKELSQRKIPAKTPS